MQKKTGEQNKTKYVTVQYREIWNTEWTGKKYHGYRKMNRYFIKDRGKGVSDDQERYTFKTKRSIRHIMKRAEKVTACMGGVAGKAYQERRREWFFKDGSWWRRYWGDDTNYTWGWEIEVRIQEA